jgi:hypothetical protein
MKDRRRTDEIDIDIPHGPRKRLAKRKELLGNGRNDGCKGPSLLIVSAAEERGAKTAFYTPVLAEVVGNSPRTFML